MTIRRITELIENPERDCIYEIIRHLNLSLSVDIGAAAGDVTAKISTASGGSSRIVAFEPFPGNHPFFEEKTKALPQTTLVKKAVSDHSEISKFIIPSMVSGAEPGWEKFAGYSSVGYLADGCDDRSASFLGKFRRHLKSRAGMLFSRFFKGTRPKVLKVQTTTLDSEFPAETIDFIKIDVQGAEGKVLKGAASLLREHRIHLLYIEWTGEQEVEAILSRWDYEIFDTTYIAGPKVNNFEPFRKIGFECVETVNLSTGKLAFEMILPKSDITPGEAIDKVKKGGLGWIQTDLLAVSPKYLDSLREAIRCMPG